MYRTQPDEYAPIGRLGVDIEIMGVKTFLGCESLAEDIACTPYGQMIADEFVAGVLKEAYPNEFKKSTMKNNIKKCCCKIDGNLKSLFNKIDKSIPVKYKNEEIGKMDKNGNIIFNSNFSSDKLFQNQNISISAKSHGTIDNGYIIDNEIDEIYIMDERTDYKNNLEFDEFQEFVNKTYYFAGESEREELLYLALATNAEAGELADEIKKMMRDDAGKLTKEREDKIKKEMGDTLFYMSILATKLDLNLSEAAKAELEKLNKMIQNWETETGLKFKPELFKEQKRNKNK